jgi:hypothetical protein
MRVVTERSYKGKPIENRDGPGPLPAPSGP